MSFRGELLLKIALVFLVIELISPTHLFSQNISLYEGEFSTTPGDTLTLPHSFLVPFSESIWNPDGQKLDPQSYFIDYEWGKLVMPKEGPAGSYQIRFQYFLHAPAPSIRLVELPRDSLEENPTLPVVDLPLDSSQQSIWNSSNIQKRGSLTRGVTAGNNRGLSLTSGLQLQLEGDLGNGLRIEGAISDENIPIQPEGTTQQLADFDRVFIRLSKGQEAITLGDYEVSFRQSRFAKLYRNVQGL